MRPNAFFNNFYFFFLKIFSTFAAEITEEVYEQKVKFLNFKLV